MLSGEPLAPALSPGYCGSHVPRKRSVPEVKPHTRISPDIKPPPSRSPVLSHYPKEGCRSPSLSSDTILNTSMWVLFHCRSGVRSPPVLGTHCPPAPTLVPSQHGQTPPAKAQHWFSPRCCTRMKSSATHRSSPPLSKPSPSSSWKLEQTSSHTIAYRH